MYPTVKQTDQVTFSIGHPKTVLESFVENTSPIHRNACILALSSMVRSKGAAAVAEESFERVCDLFEASILYFLQHPEEDESGAWGDCKSGCLLKAYLYVAEQHLSAQPLNSKGVREGPNWLSRAVSFMVSSVVGLPEERAILSRGEALKTVTYYADIGGVLNQEAFERYLHGILFEFYEKVRLAKSDIPFCNEDEWAPIERILRLMIGRKYFPQDLVRVVSSLRAQINLPRQANVFKPDPCFKGALHEKASYQLGCVLEAYART